MKSQLKNIFLAIFIFISTSIFSQTKSEKQKIIATYNINKLVQLESQFDKEYQKNQIKTKLLAQQNNWFLKKVINGNIIELVGVNEDDTPIYYTTYNIDAAISTRTNTLHNEGLLGLNLEGQNMTAYVWDAGIARITHQEYDGIGGNNRYSLGGDSAQIDDHGAHVTGTIISSGVQANAKGMAPQASAIGYDWNNDTSEVTTEASNGMLISNHSYGREAATLSDKYFGYYNYKSKNWDKIMYEAPYYLMIVSAGNDGLDMTSNGNPIEGNSNYDKLSEAKTAKNNLVIANAQDANIDSNGNVISVQIHPSSSQGPTDDYRIKPDITGNGTQLYSTIETLDDAYDIKTGTSMAAPNVTGTLLLLQQHYNNINSNFMKASTLKGLVLHTADDIGIPGPDAIYGWGLLNAKKAANIITNNETTTLIKELTLHQGQIYQFTVEADSVNDLIASISWTDPEGYSYLSGTNNATPVLVNDLDIRITQNDDVFEPFMLTSVNTSSTGDNIVDPFEKVIVNAASGSYKITITHKGELTNDTQNFSLIVTGKLENNTCVADIPSNINVFEINNNDVTIVWDIIDNANYTYRYRKLGTTIWTEQSTGLTDVNLTDLTIDTDYEFQVKSVCSDSFSVFSPIFSFRTASIGYCPNYVDVGFIDDFENETIPEVDSCWTVIAVGDNYNYVKSQRYNDNTSLSIRDYNSQDVFLVTPFLNSFDSAKRISIKNSMVTIGTMSNPNDPSTFTPYQDVLSLGYSAFSERHIDFINYNGTDNYVAFRRLDPSNYFSLDDFSYENSPSCIEPKYITANEISETTANLDWLNESDAIEWVIEYGEQDFVLGTGIQLDITSKPYYLDNLNPSTDYDIYIKAKCSTTDESEWSLKAKFKTLCGIKSPYSTYFDTQEEGSFYSYCWDNNGGVQRSNDTAHSPNYSIKISNNKNLITPYIVDFNENKRITFWLKSPYTTDDVIIGTMSNPNDETTFQPYYTITQDRLNGMFNYFIIDFKDYLGTDKYIAIANGNNYKIFLDDFIYEETPSCVEVYDVSATVLSESEVELSWIELGTATEWEIEYGEEGFEHGSGTVISVTNTTTTITGLNHSTFYEFYVRAKCSNTNVSNWLPTATKIKTYCGTWDTYYLEDFNNTNYSIEDACWSNFLITGYLPNVTTSVNSVESNGKSVKLHVNSNSHYQAATLFSPKLNGLDDGNKRIQFWLKQSSVNSDLSQIEIGTISNMEDLDTFSLLDTYDIQSIDKINWTQYTVNLENYSGTDNQIAIKLVKGSDSSESSSVYFDRFEYSEIPTCLKPTNFSVDTYNNFSATLSWDENNEATQWEIIYTEGDDFYSNTDATIIQVNTNPFTINNLITDTNYNFWIRSICDSENTSDLSEKIIINSGCGDSFNVGFTDDFNTIPNTCWEFYEFPNPSSYAQASVVYVDYTNEPNNRAMFLNSMDNTKGALLVSPLLENLSTDKKIQISLKINSGYVNVGTMSNPKDYRTFKKLATIFPENINEWEEKTIYLQDYDSNDNYIAFQALKYSIQPYNSSSPIFVIDNFSYLQSVNCTEIPNISVNNILENSVEINWNETENAIEYEYEYRLLGTYYDGVNIITTTSDNTISNLIGSTDYEVRVRAKCDEGLYTDWSDYISFSTGCDEKSAPYFESFEYNEHTLYPCWDLISDSYVVHSISHQGEVIEPVSGENFIKINSLLLTPPLQNLDNTKRIRFKAIVKTDDPAESIPFNHSKLHIGTMTDIEDETTFNLIETLEFEHSNDITYINVDDTQWKEFTIYLNDYIGEEQQIVFKDDRLDAISYGATKFYIDDFYYEEIPNCTEPLYATTDNITYESADITWENYENSNPTSWEIEYGVEGFIQGEGIIETSSENSYSLSNLLDDTYYEYYLRSNCGSENSNWSTKFRFKTPCFGVNVGYYENFDSYPSGQMKNCWTPLGPMVGIPYWDRNYVKITNIDSYPNIPSHSSPNCVSLMNETDHDIYNDEVSDRIVLVSPRLIDFDNNKKISFWLRSKPSAYSSPSEIFIGTLSDPNDYTTFTNYYTITDAYENEGDWIKYEIDFSNYYLTDQYIGIKQSSVNERQMIMIDDFEYYESECNTPSNLMAFQSGENEVTFSWQDNNTDSSPQSWEIEYGDPSLGQGNSARTIVTATTNPFVITGIDEQEYYNFYVRANCTDSTSSNWSTEYVFLVTCAENTPLIENFDSLNSNASNIFGTLDYCWVIENNNETNVSDFSSYITSFTNSAPNYLSLNNYGDLTDYNPGMFVSPFLQDLDSNKILKFWLKTGTYDTVDLIIGTIKNPTDRSTFTPYATILSGDIDDFGQEFSIDFENYTGSDNFIAFLYGGTQEYEYLFIDDIKYLDSEDCLPPYNINISNTTSTSTQINWSSLDNFQNFEIEFGLAGFTQSNGTIQITNTNEITLNNLISDTNYEFYLKTYCDSNSSLWEGPYQFHTNPTPLELPWFEGFEDLTSLGSNSFPTDFYANQYMYTTDLVFDEESWQRYPMWSFEGDNYVAGNLFHDLWLITPTFNLEANQTYFFNFKYMFEDPNPYGNFNHEHVKIFSIEGHLPTDTKHQLNQVRSSFDSYYYEQYDEATQSFTPQISGEYSFAIFYDDNSSSGGPNELSLDNLSIFSIDETTIQTSNIEDFNDSTYSNIGITSNYNATSIIDGELIFTSISSNNWVANTNKSDNSNIWLDNPSYISTLKMIVDATINPLTTLNFKLKQRYHENINESQFRVLVNGNQIGNTYQPISTYDSYQNISLDLSAYNGQIYTIELQAIGKNNKFDFSYGHGDETYLDDVQIILNNSASINDTLFTNLNYYPNPTNDKLYLTSDNKIEKVEIYNMLGQHIFLKKYNEYKVILNFTNYENAIYFVNVYIKGVKKTIKVIVKN